MNSIRTIHVNIGHTMLEAKQLTSSAASIISIDVNQLECASNNNNHIYIYFEFNTRLKVYSMLSSCHTQYNARHSIYNMRQKVILGDHIKVRKVIITKYDSTVMIT